MGNFKGQAIGEFRHGRNPRLFYPVDMGFNDVAPCVTMRTVAEALGVHVTTVSLALRGDPRIPESTRARVRESAERLGYRRNPLVQSLMKTRRKQRSPFSVRVGFVHPVAMDEASAIEAAYQGVKERARSRDVSVDTFRLPGPKEGHGEIGRLARAIDGGTVAGLIFSGGPKRYAAPPLNWGEIAAVSIDYALQQPRIHRVSLDHFDRTSAWIERAAGMGCQRLGMLMTKPYRLERQVRWLGAFEGARWRHPKMTLLGPAIVDPRERGQARGVLEGWVRHEGLDGILLPSWLRGEAAEALGDLGVTAPLFTIDWDPRSGEDRVERERRELGMLATDTLLHLIETNQRGISTQPMCWYLSAARHELTKSKSAQLMMV